MVKGFYVIRVQSIVIGRRPPSTLRKGKSAKILLHGTDLRAYANELKWRMHKDLQSCWPHGADCHIF